MEVSKTENLLLSLQPRETINQVQDIWIIVDIFGKGNFKINNDSLPCKNQLTSVIIQLCAFMIIRIKRNLIVPN